MTVNLPENRIENALPQDKVDPNTTQKNVDANVTQQIAPDVGSTSEVGEEDPNWRAFREARKKDRSEREAAEKRAAEKEAEVSALKAAMEAAFNNQLPRQQNNAYSDPYPAEESEDERIEKKVQAAIATREMAAEKARIQREHQEYPERLTRNYPDFNNVISQDNLDYLDYHYPEVSRPLQRLPDGYDRWADIYHAIKKFVPNGTNAKKDAARADANFSKPRSMSSTGIMQPGEASGIARITEDKKAANWERMQKILKGVS